MWRVLTFLALICLAAYGAVWLANSPEVLSATWGGNRYSVSLAIGVTGLVAVALLIAFVLALIHGIVRLPLTLSRRARGRRDRKGLEALSRGIVAVGAGDVAAARRYAGEAERLLGHQPLALLLKAQAAQVSGDREKAEATFREMTENRDTKVLGLRGLYLEARRRGDGEAAHEYAEEAARIAPAVDWASDAVLEALSAEGDWEGAVRMIERRTSLGLIDRAASRRQRAVLLTAEALEKEASDQNAALATAEKAVKLAPDLVPAAALAGRLLSGRGELKKAAKIIEAAWSAHPHPDLAGAYLNLRPGDSATDRLKRAETLAKLSSWSDEARLAVARAAIEARDFARAREAVKPLVEAGRPTVRTCMTMAEIEGRSGQSGAAREWLARATHAPRDKAWIADGYVSERWLPISPVSGRLDAFAWETPPELLGDGGGPDVNAFEPDAIEEDVPAFLGRTIAPPAAVSADPDLVPRAPPPQAAPPASPAATETPTVAKPAVDAAESKAGSGTSGVGTGTSGPRTGTSSTDPVPKVAAPDPDVKPAPAAAAQAAPSPTAPSPPPARRDGANGGADAARPPAEPEPVVFPVRHAPDDPGLEGEADRRQRFRLRV